MKSLSFKLCFLLSIFIIRLEAQTITGSVLEEGTDEVLIGAHILCLDAWEIGTTTDQNGEFVLKIPDSLFSEETEVLVRFIGFEEKVVKVNNDRKDQIIYLTPSSKELQSVSVDADRLISEDFSVKKLSRLEVYKNPAAKGDAILAVNSLASSTTLDESANISFRGTGPQRTGIFLNGVPIYDAVRFSQLNGIGTFSIFNTDLLQSVYVYPGNPPLEFGNVSGGMIALETNDQIPEVFQGNILTSLASSGVNLKFALNESTGIKLFSNYQYSGPIKGVNEDALEDVNSFGSVDAGLQLIHKNPNGSKLKVFQYLLNESYEVGFNSPTYDGVYHQKGIKNITILNYLHPLKKGAVSVNSSYSFSGLDLNFSSAQYLIENHSVFTSVNYQRERSKRSFKVGLSFDNRTEDFQGRVPLYGFAIKETHPFTSVVSSQDRPLIEPYAYYKYRPSDIISFGMALRSNIPVDGMKSYLSYQSTIKYDPRNAHLFRLSRGKFHQYVVDESSFDRTLISSNQIAIDHEFATGDIENVNSIYFNRSEIGNERQRIFGIETTWKYNYASNSFIEVSYSGLDAKAIGVEQNTSLKYDLNYFIRLSAQHEFSGYWTIGVRGLFRQGQYSSAVEQVIYRRDLMAYEPVYQQNNARLPAYNIVDLNISKLVPVSQKLVLVIFGSVSNVLDSENVSSYSYNFDYSERQRELFSRRTFYAGISFNFQ